MAKIFTKCAETTSELLCKNHRFALLTKNLRGGGGWVGEKDLIPGRRLSNVAKQ